MMEFYVFNASLELVGIVDSYKSAIWTTRYNQPGDFELYLPALLKNITLLQKGYIVIRLDDTTKGGIIDSIKISTDEENGDYLTITGKSLSGLLSRRIMWYQTTYSGNAEKLLRVMITEHCIDPYESNRQLPNVLLGEEVGLTETINLQAQGESIEDLVVSVCKSLNLGYKVDFDMENRKFIFNVYKGVDRSYNQNVNSFVVFSPDFDNLLTSEYSNSVSTFKNVALVGGEGEGAERTMTTVNNSIIGMERFETFVDAKSQSSNGGELSDSAYLSLLYQQGMNKLSELNITKAVSSQIASDVTFKLNQDYFLGDIVQVKNEYGMSMTPRVTEIIECQDENGYSCIPTFTNESN